MLYRQIIQNLAPLTGYKPPDNALTGDKAIPYTLPYFRSSKRVVCFFPLCSSTIHTILFVKSEDI